MLDVLIDTVTTAWSSYQDRKAHFLAIAFAVAACVALAIWLV